MNVSPPPSTGGRSTTDSDRSTPTSGSNGSPQGSPSVRDPAVRDGHRLLHLVFQRTTQFSDDSGDVLRRPARWLHESDPGLLRLVQAVKTVLAVVVTLAIFRHAALQTRLFAGIGSAFLMQCTSTGTRRRRQVTMAVFAVSMVFCVTVAAGVFGNRPLAQDAWLLVVAFAAFYTHRFLPDQGMVTVFGFVVTLLSTAVPSGWGNAGAEAKALGVGGAIAFAVHFYVLPPDPWRAFIDGLGIFAARAARAMAVLHTALRERRVPPLHKLRGLYDQLQAPLAFNQQLFVQWGIALGGDAVSDLLVFQYETTQALGMLGGSVRRLIEGLSPAPVTPPGEPATPADQEQDFPDDLPPAVLARLLDLLADQSRRFQKLAAGLCGDDRQLRELAADPALEEGEPSGDSDSLQSAVLRAYRPLCPQPAQLLGALVALNQLSALQRQIARVSSSADALSSVATHAPTESTELATPTGPHWLWSNLRTPLRAAVSVAIALAVGHLLAFERSYWAVLVSILLVNGTWGENTRRGLTRFSMTVAGCAAALGLHALTHGHRPGQIAVMLTAILLAAYFRTNSYPLLTFFVSLYVIFLFALMGQSPAHMLLIRTGETFVGCAVAMIASAIVLPPRSTRQWEEQLAKVWDSCRRVVETALSRLSSGRCGGAVESASAGTPNVPDVKTLLDQLRSLRTYYDAAIYEGIPGRASRRRRQEMMDRTRQLAHHALGLAEAVCVSHDTAAVQFLHEEIDSLGCRLMELFDEHSRLSANDTAALNDSYPSDAARPDGTSDEKLDRIQQRIRAQLQDNSTGRQISWPDLAWLGSVIYHARQISGSLLPREHTQAGQR